MPTNDFLPFAIDVNAGVMSQTDYAERAGLGVVPGIADPDFANKAWRQGANMAAALGRIVAARGYDALDNGDLNALQRSVADAISVGTFNRMFFSQTSGTYTAPRTGVYRITLKGGGGGGAGAQDKNPGNGGGEGGTVVFYALLIRSTSYSYTIGAGGTAGAVATNGGNGGTSSMVVDDVTYAAYGGTGGRVSQSFGGAIGGSGAPASAYIIQGAPGQSAINNVSAVSSNYFLGASGGGNGGGVSFATGSQGTRGGGGGGGSYFSATSGVGGAGGDGYILIEYAG